MAVHIENDIAVSSSFPCGQNNSWKLWCVEASASHQRVVQQIANQHVLMELDAAASASFVAAVAAAPAAVLAPAASASPTTTLTTNFPCAAQAMPAANGGESWTELLGDDRQLVRRSGRCAREAAARAGGQPPANALPAGPTRRHEVYWHCCLCNTQHKQLRLCWECNTWACSQCSFWCTLCPKGKDKYNICGGCNATGWYLWKKRATVWSCWKCW